MTGPGLDLAAVSADDRVLDLLATRSEVEGGSRGDGALALLQALTGAVDDGLELVLRTPLVLSGASHHLSVVTEAGSGAGSGGESLTGTGRPVAARWRRLGPRTVAATVLVMAALSVSGAAAAVTGDPLTAYDTVKGFVVTVTGRDDQPSEPVRVVPDRPAGHRGRASELPGGGASGRTAEGSARSGRGSTPSLTPSRASVGAGSGGARSGPKTTRTVAPTRRHESTSKSQRPGDAGSGGQGNQEDPGGVSSTPSMKALPGEKVEPAAAASAAASAAAAVKPAEADAVRR